MTPPPTLARTQQLLWNLITAPEGAAAGVASLDPLDRALADALVRPDGLLSPIERIDIYADMYFYRLRDCLQEDFAAVHAVFDVDRFQNLITDYLLAHPPVHFSLRQAGRHLPLFISTYPAAAAYPFLAQLAALEWAVLEAFDAADAAPLEISALQATSPAQWPDLHFELTPSLQQLDVDWRVDTVLSQVQNGEVPAPPVATATCVRVWRQDYRVFYRPIDTAEAAALQALGQGETFAGVCTAVGELIGEADGAERVVQLLDTWFADGLITACRV